LDSKYRKVRMIGKLTEMERRGKQRECDGKNLY
jgi:hypothetical protein